MSENAMSEGGARQAPRTELSRDMSCFDITMIGVGAMIGAGIFVLTGIAAGTAGPALILAFAINGIVAFFTAMVYAELGSAIPEAGGGYLWIKEGLPGGSAFISGWMSWFAHAVAGSLYALGFGSYGAMALVRIFGWHLSPAHHHELELGLTGMIVLIFVYINYRGASEAGLAGNIVTVAKVLILLMFIASGMYLIFGHSGTWANFHPKPSESFAPNGLGGIVAAMGLTFIAFEGYEIIVQAGEEVKHPKRNVPRAVFWCMAIVLPIYILVAFVAIGATKPTVPGMSTWAWLYKYKELGLVEAAGQFMFWGTPLLLLGGVLSTMSALNATTFSSTRVSFAMGRDRNFPDAFAHIHSRTRTPMVALLASGAIILAMAEFVPIEAVAAASDIMFLLLFLQVNIAAITIRKRYGDKLQYGYVTPFFPVIPVIGIVANLALAGFMIYHYIWPAGVVALLWLLVGAGLWLFYAKPREKRKTVTPIIMSELPPTEKKRFRILVPVANPATAEGLIEFAGRLAKVKDGEVILLHALRVPQQLPPSAARGLIADARPVIDKVALFAEKRGIPVSSLVRIAHRRVWKAIVDTIEEYQVDFVVMGWRGESKDKTTAVGRNIDQVVKHANCDAAILQNTTEADVARALVPIAQPFQGELMLLAARMLTKPDGGRIDMLHVNKPGDADTAKTTETIQAIEAMAEKAKQQKAKQAEAKDSVVSVLRAEHALPFEEIVRRSQTYDVLVMGSAPQSWLHRSVFAPGARHIATRVACPVVLVSRRSHAIKYNVQTFFQFFRDVHEESKKAEDGPPTEADGDAPAAESDAGAGDQPPKRDEIATD